MTIVLLFTVQRNNIHQLDFLLSLCSLRIWNTITKVRISSSLVLIFLFLFFFLSKQSFLVFYLH